MMKVSPSPAARAAANSPESSSGRFGATGLGATRGGSIRRKSASVAVVSSSLERLADSRRDRS